MQFDQFTVVLLVLRPDAPQLSGDAADALVKADAIMAFPFPRSSAAERRR